MTPTHVSHVVCLRLRQTSLLSSLVTQWRLSYNPFFSNSKVLSVSQILHCIVHSSNIPTNRTGMPQIRGTTSPPLSSGLWP
ncbi:hypothetical protein HETIRDRAFT_162898 [Heterobasidion irregulare TC 32-1]|uniref:Uncharacterized protein n=1 Tax=Heterobasidion irregulare (strain TC 32-1) TaxID=747525 RepID=W4JSQ8_HETIT|nr:uncharacterized protein HETIRDRAFT_162898 [Heterobasidion irregulare TC 32-1]ETW76145.1 hypothetical protein HETIRDRAFT_162898 [Heterobasidion irregulare TC 32-1]